MYERVLGLRFRGRRREWSCRAKHRLRLRCSLLRELYKMELCPINLVLFSCNSSRRIELRISDSQSENMWRRRVKSGRRRELTISPIIVVTMYSFLIHVSQIINLTSTDRTQFSFHLPARFLELNWWDMYSFLYEPD